MDTVKPELSEHSLIEFQSKVVEVIKVDTEFIYIKNGDLKEMKIGDNEWLPIFLDNDWLTKFGLKENQKIQNIRTGLDWSVRRFGKYYYLTIKNDVTLGENPIIPVHWVHDLQHWYYLLINSPLKID